MVAVVRNKMNVVALNKQRYKRIVILTGAGISVSSGLRPYRGPGGLWEEEETRKYSTAESVTKDPAGVWKMWGTLRQAADAAQPSPAHFALAQFEKSLDNGQQKMVIITQNVDGLHQRAGSGNVVELHGSLFRTRCSSPQCKQEAVADRQAHTDAVPRCQNCAAPLRPDIVFFNEMLPVDAEYNAKRALRDCDLFVAIGTSGSVCPASRFVEWAKYASALTYLVNLQPLAVPSRSFDRELIGSSDQIIPRLFSVG